MSEVSNAGATFKAIWQRLLTGATGLEPATSGVTGRRSNQLNYAPWGRVIVAIRFARDARRLDCRRSRGDLGARRAPARARRRALLGRRIRRGGRDRRPGRAALPLGRLEFALPAARRARG